MVRLLFAYPDLAVCFPPSLVSESELPEHVFVEIDRSLAFILIWLRSDLFFAAVNGCDASNVTGATAVLLGRPVFFSLACGGQEGVQRMLEIIKDELEAAMALCGCQVGNRIRPKLRQRGGGGVLCSLLAFLWQVSRQVQSVLGFPYCFFFFFVGMLLMSDRHLDAHAAHLSDDKITM